MTDVSTLDAMGYLKVFTLQLTGTQAESYFKFNEPYKNVVSIEVVSALIPRGDYTIESDRCTLVYNVNDTQYSLSIPSRDYSLVELCDELTSTMGNNIAVSKVPGENKMFFTCTSVFSLDMTKSTCQRAVGMSTENTTAQLNSNLVYEIKSVNKCNLMGTECVRLSSDIDSIISGSKSGDYSTGLAKFFVTDGTHSQYVTLTNHSMPFRYFSPIAKLSKLKLNFLRGHKEPNADDFLLYDMKGSSYYIDIVIKCVDLGKNWQDIGNQKMHYQTLSMFDTILKHSLTVANEYSENKSLEVQTKEVSNSEPRNNNKFKVLTACFGIYIASKYLNKSPVY